MTHVLVMTKTQSDLTNTLSVGDWKHKVFHQLNVMIPSPTSGTEDPSLVHCSNLSLCLSQVDPPGQYLLLSPEVSTSNHEYYVRKIPCKKTEHNH